MNLTCYSLVWEGYGIVKTENFVQYLKLCSLLTVLIKLIAAKGWRLKFTD